MKKHPGIFIILTTIGLTLCSLAQEEKTAKPDDLPLNFKLHDLPEIVQVGKGYCVPAAGAWIAKYHGIKTDQQQMAELSSQASMDDYGTNPMDMARAMENFGFRYHQIENKHTPGNVDEFIKKTLPRFKEALVHEGPMYITWAGDNFGGSGGGHALVVIGYSDTRKEMYFYNPWGVEYSAPYREVEKYTRSAIAFTPPKPLGDKIIDCTALIETLQQLLPSNAQNVIELKEALNNSSIAFELTECNRMDLMDDAKKTERLARRESRIFIDLAMERVPAILIPQTDNEGVTDYLFIRKSPKSKRKLLVQRIGSHGWEAPELSNSRLLIRDWTTPVVNAKGGTQWLLPLFEFSGTNKAPRPKLTAQQDSGDQDGSSETRLGSGDETRLGYGPTVFGQDAALEHSAGNPKYVGEGVFYGKCRNPGSQVKVNGKEVADYIYAPAPSKVAYAIPSWAETFSAWGVAPSGNFSGRWRYMINIDGKQVYCSKPLREYGFKTVSIHIEIPQGAKQLELLVESTRRNYPYAGPSIWALPEFR